jgi:hypothetical protein
MLSRVSVSALMVSLLLLVGCGGNQPTYINIPQQEGSVAFSDPNGDVVRAVVAEAMRGMMLEYAFPTPVAVVMPGDATALTHADVARRVGADAISPFEPGITPGTTIEAREVRVRGHRGEVDMVHPGRGGISHLTTVYLTWGPFDGWRSERIRTWQGSAQQVLPSHELRAAPARSPN